MNKLHVIERLLTGTVQPNDIDVIVFSFHSFQIVIDSSAGIAHGSV